MVAIEASTDNRLSHCRDLHRLTIEHPLSRLRQGESTMSRVASNGEIGCEAFQARHRGDRIFFIACLLFIWTAILMGFGPGAIKQFGGEGTPRPLYLHLHAIAFFGWLALLTVQFTLVQTRQVRVHGLLGIGGAGLAAIMVVLGTWTALESVSARIARGSNPGFLAVQLMDLFLFAALAAAALIMRTDRAAHRRLILMATLQLTGAGFGRWLGKTLGPMFADFGILGGWVPLYGLVGVGMAALGLYDLATRGRFHRLYLPSVAFALAGQFIALLLVQNPDWIAFVTRVAGY